MSHRLDQGEEVLFETDVKGGIQFQSSGVVSWGWGAGGRNIFRAATAKVKTGSPRILTVIVREDQSAEREVHMQFPMAAVCFGFQLDEAVAM